MLSKIRWVLLHVNHSSSLLKRIIRVLFCAVKSHACILEEASCEVITVHNSKNSAVNIEIAAEIKISPSITDSCIFRSRNFVAFQKHTLRDSTILNSLLYNM